METKKYFYNEQKKSRSHLGGEKSGDAGGGAGPHRVQVQLRAPEVGWKKMFYVEKYF